MRKPIQSITPMLWFAKEAEDAAKFYVSIFPDSWIDRVTVMPAETPNDPPGTVNIVEFTLFGQPFIAMSAKPIDKFNHAISLVVYCETQAEVDRYWAALAEGGTIEPCGWVRDRFGVEWQVTPAILRDLMADRDHDAAKRTAEAMMKMHKLDIAALQSAHDHA
jgi:predicted 3-demethylubiquinone-9 3-methyltransferase (glyoxalase superfamily)